MSADILDTLDSNNVVSPQMATSLRPSKYPSAQPGLVNDPSIAPTTHSNSGHTNVGWHELLIPDILIIYLSVLMISHVLYLARFSYLFPSNIPQEPTGDHIDSISKVVTGDGDIKNSGFMPGNNRCILTTFAVVIVSGLVF